MEELSMAQYYSSARCSQRGGSVPWIESFKYSAPDSLMSTLSAVRSPPLLSSDTLIVGQVIRQTDMSGSAVADIRYTYGAAFIGLLLSTVCVFSLPSPCLPAELANL